MVSAEELVETIEYRVLLLQPESFRVLVRDACGIYRLPRVRIYPRARVAEHLRTAVQNFWGLQILFLEFSSTAQEGTRCAVAQVLCGNPRSEWKTIPLHQVASSELSDEERHLDSSILLGICEGAFAKLGWIDDAVAWIEDATHKTICSRAGIEQYNGGGGFSLIRFRMADDSFYWLKATSQPNAHEFGITSLLSAICAECLPELIATKPEWNAWLTAEITKRSHTPGHPEGHAFLRAAVASMAHLQKKTTSRCAALVKAGAFDQTIETFQEHSDRLFDYLIEIMPLQTSTKVPPIKRDRLEELRGIVAITCARMQAFDLPASIVHGDLNRGNVLDGEKRCVFTDWAEAYVGNPLISLQHLLLLKTRHATDKQEMSDQQMKRAYLDVWTDSGLSSVLERALPYMPLLGVLSALYGRGDWLGSDSSNDPHRQSYARSLARQMDRVARTPDLLEALCH